MPKKKSARREKVSRKSIVLPASHEILSEQITKILDRLGPTDKDNASLRESDNSVLEGSVEFALKQELEDSATDCIYFFDEPKPEVEPQNIKTEPDYCPEYSVKTEGKFLTPLIYISSYHFYGFNIQWRDSRYLLKYFFLPITYFFHK